MKSYARLLVIGWSIVCVGIIVSSFKAIATGSQTVTVEMDMFKAPSGGWQDILKIESLSEPPGVIPIWFKEIANANPKSLEYREKRTLDRSFYIRLPAYAFAVWAVPIVVFSLIGLLFDRKG